ncbi:Bardet-Biedl syndrome 5 [Volvox carteri f. nagariensis]|uniref:BBSome complex member BBS5 n=1 Tax=Volvox carteri f. nagariensis TaxID=3068 RepID=D8TIQ4_VOLCA|nr:Bardet-Biedl syndrome 5 [Volvox carteri f. nagariensis]EFJ53283.1 Bardet-Biedl syndrome 5 [Volvox carteri f. nagariensis]|eukprot:XP_002946288.1 Bardet-Biedl syndrome 5 [Volvox carteri f. nagariensis]
MVNRDSAFCWQDRELRFDSSLTDINPRQGEEVLSVLESVEDTKGNNGDLGELVITTLRLMWISKKNRRTNISVGHSCITSINVRSATSRLKGQTQSLFILTKYHTHRFEFVFTALADGADTLFSCVQGVFKAYDNSRLYRELKLRGAFIADRELKLLPLEQTYSRVQGVYNLSAEQGNLGAFFISNVRVVWYAQMAENFNVSIPYLQIRSVKLRDSKFGQALVIETSAASGGYVLGFKVDPKETLDYVYKEISSLWQVYAAHPVFGVEYRPESSGASGGGAFGLTPSEQDVEIVDPPDRGDALALYYADATKGVDRDPVYCAELGLAIEQLKEGLTIEQLWSVL